jgi:hypothetical protein
MSDPIRMVHVLSYGQSLRANPALIPGVDLIALHFNQLTILDFELKTTSAV